MPGFVNRVLRFKETSADKKGREGLSVMDAVDDPAALAASLLYLPDLKEEWRIKGPRASSLFDDCTRMLVIAAREGLYKTDSASLADRVVMGTGTAFHRWAQNSPDLFGKYRYGWWRCRACGDASFFGGPPKRRCGKCGASPGAFEYKEHYFEIKDPFYLTGHPDLFIKVRKGLFRIVELKFFSSSVFASITTPAPSVWWQVVSYLLSSKYDEKLPVEVDSKVAYVLYVSKEVVSNGRFQAKAFKVAPESFDPQLRKLETFKASFENYPEKLPPLRPQCRESSFNHGSARRCVAFQQCRDFYKKGGG